MPTRIGQSLTTALRTDNRVTKEEAQQLVAEAKTERKWTPQMQKELRTFVAKNGAKLDPQAKAVLEQFISSARARADLPDPKVLTKHATNVTWQPVGADAKLHVDGITADDVTQGSIGDCYLAAAMSSVAAANPELVNKAIKDNGDGTYTVRFYEGVGDGGRPKAVKVTVDDDLPTAGGGTAKYAKARDKNELWPTVLEKAYAKWKGGYEKIGNGGSASDVFAALSGKEPDWGTVKEYQPDALFSQIKDATSEHKPVAAGTFGDEQFSYTNTGLYGNHFYTVLGTSEENGTKYVQLRNPWGSSEPGSDGKDDGIFKLPLADFMKLYDNIEFGG